MIVGVPVFAVIVTIVKEFVEQKLRNKNLPTDTADYYERDSLVDPYEKHETMLSTTVKNIKSIASKIILFFKKQINKIKEKLKRKDNEEK